MEVKPFFKNLGIKNCGLSQILAALYWKNCYTPSRFFKKSQVNFYIKLFKKAIDFFK